MENSVKKFKVAVKATKQTMVIYERTKSLAERLAQTYLKSHMMDYPELEVTTAKWKVGEKEEIIKKYGSLEDAVESEWTLAYKR